MGNAATDTDDKIDLLGGMATIKRDRFVDDNGVVTNDTDGGKLINDGLALARKIKRMVNAELDALHPGSHSKQGIVAMVAAIVDYRICEMSATSQPESSGPHSVWLSLHKLLRPENFHVVDEEEADKFDGIDKP